MSTQTDTIRKALRHERECYYSTPACICGTEDALAALSELERHPSRTEDLPGEHKEGESVAEVPSIGELVTHRTAPDHFVDGIVVKSKWAFSPDTKCVNVAWRDGRITSHPPPYRDLVRAHPPKPSTEARDKAIEALEQALVVWNDGDDKLVRMYINQALAALSELERQPSQTEAEAMCGDHGGIEGCSCSLCGSPLGPRELCAYCNGCGAPVKWPMADGAHVHQPSHRRPVQANRRPLTIPGK